MSKIPTPTKQQAGFTFATPTSGSNKRDSVGRGDNASPFSGNTSRRLSMGPIATTPQDGTPQSRLRNHSEETERVKVVLRIRPALREDETSGAVQVSEDGKSIKLCKQDATSPPTEFKFDKVLSSAASQCDVYESGVRDVVEDVMEGFNGTVMAYGQTGAGKTYTLGNTEPQAIGMIPRCVGEIFNKATHDNFYNYKITMSYIQIYMELIQDLLRPESENLNMREDVDKGIFISGVKEVQVTNLEECLAFLSQGEKNRTFAFTHLNAHSSRSHAVVIITVVKSRKYLTAQEKAEMKKMEAEGGMWQKVKVGKLFLVDLAGSERLKKSHSVGIRADEAKHINQSLHTLGKCINARANDAPHVPFRDSKLTRLLQDSLGGNAKTTLVLCVADAVQHSHESLQSLLFGGRAMKVKNKPMINERTDYRTLHAELLSQMDQQTEKAAEWEIELLRSEEEKEELLAALEKEKEQRNGLMAALELEAKQRLEAVSNELQESQKVAATVTAAKTQLEAQLVTVKEEQQKQAHVYGQEVADLRKQVEDLHAAMASAQSAYKREAAAMTDELCTTQQQLDAAHDRCSVLDEQNASLRAELHALQASHNIAADIIKAIHDQLANLVPHKLPSIPAEAEALLQHRHDELVQKAFTMLSSKPGPSYAKHVRTTADDVASRTAPGIGSRQKFQTSNGRRSTAQNIVTTNLAGGNTGAIQHGMQHDAGPGESTEQLVRSALGDASGCNAENTALGSGLLGSESSASSVASVGPGGDDVGAAGTSGGAGSQEPASNKPLRRGSVDVRRSTSGAKAPAVSRFDAARVTNTADAAASDAALHAQLASLLTATVPTIAHTVAVYQTAYSNVSQEVAALDADLEAKIKEATQLADQLRVTSATLARSQQEAADLSAQLDSTREELRDVQCMLMAEQELTAQQSSVVSGQEAKLDLLEGQLDGLQKQLEATTASLQDTSTQLASTQQDLKDTRDQLEATQQSLEDTESMLSSTQADLYSTQADLHSTQADLHSTHLDLEGTKKQLSDTRSSLADTSRQLAQTRASLLQTTAQLEESQASLASTRTDLASTKDSLRVSQRKLHETRVQLMDTQQELADAQASLEQTKSTLSQEKQEHDALKRSHTDLVQLSARNQDNRMHTHAERVHASRRLRAARTIQSAWRAWKTQQLHATAARDKQALSMLEAASREAAAASQLSAAQQGASMVLDSMTVMREAVEGVLIAFVGRKKELELRERLAARIACAAPVISLARQASMNSNAGNTGSHNSQFKPGNKLTSTMRVPSFSGGAGGAGAGPASGGGGPLSQSNSILNNVQVPLPPLAAQHATHGAAGGASGGGSTRGHTALSAVVGAPSSRLGSAAGAALHQRVGSGGGAPAPPSPSLANKSGPLSIPRSVTMAATCNAAAPLSPQLMNILTPCHSLAPSASASPDTRMMSLARLQAAGSQSGAVMRRRTDQSVSAPAVTTPTGAQALTVVARDAGAFSTPVDVSIAAEGVKSLMERAGPVAEKRITGSTVSGGSSRDGTHAGDDQQSHPQHEDMTPFQKYGIPAYHQSHSSNGTVAAPQHAWHEDQHAALGPMAAAMLSRGGAPDVSKAPLQEHRFSVGGIAQIKTGPGSAYALLQDAGAGNDQYRYTPAVMAPGMTNTILGARDTTGKRPPADLGAVRYL